MAITPQSQMTKAVMGRMHVSFPGAFPGEQAREHAEEIVEAAFEIQKEIGTDALPKKAAKLVLSESTALLPEGYLQYLTAEGVTVKDIERWWNQPDIYRCTDAMFDAWRLDVYFNIYLLELGDPEQAWSMVYRRQPCFVYGPPVEHERLKGDDRPLPFEVNHRFDAFLRKALLKHGRDSFWAETDKYGTVNRMFREKIRNGEA